ncbi:MAG: hypothetical protein PHE89_01005 [Alphaproteobacteria bacterium]|nr:hypothetical protein [Alphaproteobacteria bacterium]
METNEFNLLADFFSELLFPTLLTMAYYALVLLACVVLLLSSKALALKKPKELKHNQNNKVKVYIENKYAQKAYQEKLQEVVTLNQFFSVFFLAATLYILLILSVGKVNELQTKLTIILTLSILNLLTAYGNKLVPELKEYARLIITLGSFFVSLELIFIFTLNEAINTYIRLPVGIFIVFSNAFNLFSAARKIKDASN